MLSSACISRRKGKKIIKKSSLVKVMMEAIVGMSNYDNDILLVINSSLNYTKPVLLTTSVRSSC